MSSVRKAQRSKTPEKFIVGQAAEKLVDYSYLITENKKIFPDEYPPKPKDPTKLSKWVISCRKRDIAKAMLLEVRNYTLLMAAKIKTANSIVARNTNDFDLRIKLEEEALQYAYIIKQIISITAKSYHLSKRKFEFWNSLIDFLIIELKSWIKSERKGRYFITKVI